LTAQSHYPICRHKKARTGASGPATPRHCRACMLSTVRGRRRLCRSADWRNALVLTTFRQGFCAKSGAILDLARMTTLASPMGSR
jgi:hypothetical protein